MAIKLGEAVLFLNADPTELNRKIGETNRQFKRDFGNIADLSRKVGLGFTIMGGAITAGLGTGVLKAAEFSQSMGELNTLGVQHLGVLEGGVKRVAAQFGQELGPTAKATYDIISAGIPEGNALDVLSASAQAAVAGVSDVGTAAKLGTATLNAFGMEASQIGVVFGQAFIAVKGGVTTFDELAASVGKVAPVMAAAGLESEEMFAAVAALTKGGLATAEAVTGLKAAMSNIISPTREAQKVAESLGLQFDVSALQSQGLAGFLESVKNATGGNIETMAQLFSSTEALNAVLALTGNQSQSLTDILGNMGNAQTATQEAFDAFKAANPAFAFDQLKASVSVLMVDIGSALLPALSSIVQAVAPVVARLGEWMRAHPGLTQAIIGVTAVIGGLMAVIGPILIILPGLIVAFGGISAALGVLGGAFVVVATGPVVAFIVGFTAVAAIVAGVVAAIVAAGKWLISNWTEIGEVFAGIWQAIVSAIQSAANFIGGIIQGVIDTVRNAVSAVGDFLGFASGGLIPFANGGIIPAMANGGVIDQIQKLGVGGVAKHRIVMVGERGPELAALPVGSRVMSHGDMRDQVRGGGGGGNITLNSPVTIHATVRNDMDVEKIARAVTKAQGRMLMDASTRRGLRPGLGK